MRQYNNIQDTMQLIADFKKIANRMFSLGNRLNFPNIEQCNGEQELCEAIKKVEILLHAYLDDSMEREIINEQNSNMEDNTIIISTPSRDNIFLVAR